MSVAALEAELLGSALDSRLGQARELNEIASIYLNRLDEMLSVPGSTAAQHYAYPHLEKDRPRDYEERNKLQGALGRFAAKDPAIHKLTWEISNLLKPGSAHREPQVAELIAREVRC